MTTTIDIAAILVAADCTSPDGTFVHASTEQVCGALMSEISARDAEIAGLKRKLRATDVQIEAAARICAWEDLTLLAQIRAEITT